MDFDSGIDSGMDSGFDFGFGMISIAFVFVMAMVIGIILVMLIMGIKRWRKNNQSPVLLVNASVVGKRMDVSSHHTSNDSGFSSSTSYYVTFEFETQDRMELMVDAYRYGLMVEQDYGKLKFQGSRFLDFVRE